jgi:hypothetical protein
LTVISSKNLKQDYSREKCELCENYLKTFFEFLVLGMKERTDPVLLG